MMLGMLVPLIATSMQGAELKAGMTITRSLKVAKRTYNLPSSDDLGKTAAVVVKGNNITVDFGGSTLLGRSLNRAPDTRTGTAVLVTGKNVVIRNLKAHGYKIGLIARNAPGLKIVDCDFSYNWKQRLLSTLDKEDSSDWMSFHKNEADEWLRFGAGVYLRNCDNFEVKNVTIRNGQCGLMLTNCNKGLVWNSDFSFLSAIGLGMYRSSENRIMHNNIDWCVRGYSHGRWNRGQDSAGILIYEQSHKNKFAYNSVTHGGDGFFLWAGQTTMDTGEGG
ncbi:MAG TPA: right-handed parallel beta-helix repeat-containing protein, partial [Fimbriimonadaceae bacterium]|nr:right-handed parallel beta-helix repeat-containing protein [Fimbriimonadaceae bacterium]